MQLKQNTSILEKDENVSENVRPHKDEKLILKERDIQEDHRNLRDKSSDIESHTKSRLSRRTSQVWLLESELSSSWKNSRFRDQEFAIDIPVSNIKYNHPRFHNNNLFYSFYDHLNYRLAKYFAKFKTSKSNIDKFLSEPLIVLLIEKLSYWNVDQKTEKFSEIPWDIPNNK